MGKHQQRSMAYLLKNGASLSTPRITPVLEGKARMQGPLDELPSNDDFKLQKVCRNCRNSTEGTQVQCCSICNGEYHTFCLESSIDADIQNKRLCYTCQISAFTIKQTKVILDVEVIKQVTEETDIVIFNEDAKACEKLAEDAVKVVDKDNDTAESAGCFLPDSNRKSATSKFLDTKLNTRRKRLSDNAENENAHIKVRAVSLTEKEEETDRQLKYEMVSTVDNGLPRGEARDDGQELPKSNGFKTERILQQVNSETKPLIRSSDAFEDLPQPDAKNEKVVEEMSMDRPESSFSCSEKQEKRQLEGAPKIEVSMCLSVEEEKTAEMTLEAGMAKKYPNVEIKESIGLQSAPGELRPALHMLERDELIGTLEGHFQSSNTADQNVVNRINEPSSETEKNITICIDMGKGAGSHPTVQNINYVNAQRLVVEDKVKRVSDDRMIDQKDAEVLGCHGPAQEPFLSKRQSTSCGRDAVSPTINSALLALSASAGGTCTSVTFEAQTLAAERKELECDHQGLCDSVGRKVASSSPNFISLDSDATVNSNSLFLGNMDSNPLKYVSNASPRHVSTSNTLHLESMEVVEDDTGKSQSVEVMDQSLGQVVPVQNETLNINNAATLKNIMEVAIEQSGDVRPLADISDHSHQQEVELQTADGNTSKHFTCSMSYLHSEDLTTRHLGDISINKLSTDDDAKVCDICGDAGYEEMLAVCSECNEGAEHVYCMQTLMDQVPDGYWLCEGCKMKQKASGRNQFEPRTTHSFLTRSSSMTYIKKQANFGNSRLRLTARLEKRKLGPERRQLKSNPLVQGPSKRQAEDAFQAPSRKLTEDTMFAPAAKKQIIEISGTSGTPQASSSSTLRPALSREGSFKNPDSGKVKFLSPSAVAGLNATAHGTSSTVRGAGKPVVVSNSSLSRTISGQFSQQLTSRSRFVSLTSPVSDSLSGGGPGSKVANNPPLNTLVSTSNPMSPSLKNSFSNSSDSGPTRGNLKSSFGGAKISHKSLKEALEGVAQARESLPAGQTAIGNTRILSKGDSFKSYKGVGFVSDQKSLPDDARVPIRLQNIRAAPFDAIFKSSEAKIDSQFSPLTSTGTLELKANASTFAEGASKSVQIILSDGTTELKEKVSTAEITDGNGSSQAASLSNATGDLGMKNPLTVNLSSLPHIMQPVLPTPVITHSDCMTIPKADITVPLQASPLKMSEDCLTTDICQKQRKTDMAGKETGKLTSLNENIAQQDRTHDTFGKETGKVRSLNGNITQQDRAQPQIDPSYALAGPQGSREILSGSTSPVVKLEASSSMKGLGSCRLDTGSIDLTSEEKLPVSPDQSAIVEETKRNLSPIPRTSVTWTPSTFMPSVSTRCYKCKELGHSAQFCASRSSSFNNTIPEYSLTSMQSPLSIAPSVNISKESIQIAAAKSQNAIVPEIGNSRKVLEADVEGLPKVSNLHSQKSLIELQSHEDKSQASAFLKGPTSLGRNELEPKPKPGLPFGEAQDLTVKSCEPNPSHFPTSSSLPIEMSRDTSFITPAMPFPRPFTPNRMPFGIATSVTQMPIGNIAVTGNPTVCKEASQKIATPHHQFIPDPSYTARFGTSPVASYSVETVPRFTVPTSIASLAAETSTLALTNKGPGFWMPGAISMHQVTTAVCTRPVAQTPNPQIDCLKSPVAEPYYLWRGAFEVTSKVSGINVFDGVQAHPSNRAVPKVHEVTRKLQSPLYLEELPRSSEHNCWPLQFQNCPPTSENIALYFFAKDKESYERSYRPLVDHMLKHDLALRGIVEDAELLIFPSSLLPANSQRWNQFMFLWAVFRDRKVSVSCPVGHHALSAARQTNFDASRQSNVDAKVQRIVVSSLSENREEKTNIDIQGKDEKLVKISDMAESSRALNSLRNGAVPCMQTEVTTSQLVCMQSDTSSIQDASRLIQGGQQEDTNNQDQQPIKAPAECNLDSSSFDLQRLAPASQQGECKGSAIAPGSGSTDQKTTLLSKPVEEGGSHVNTTTKIAVNTEIQVTCTDSFQVQPKKCQSKVDSPRITCQSPPASLNCPSPKKRRGDTILAVDKHRHSKSRSSGWSKDRERGLKDYPFEKGRGLERVDSSRASNRERDRDRERRYRERDREWERERAREWDGNREREKRHGRERNWEREQDKDGIWGRDHGRRRDLDVVDRDHERNRHKYPYSTSRSRSPPRRRSLIKWSHSYDRYHSLHCSRSYSNSPESVHGSVRQQTPQQTDSKGRSQESHSQRGPLSADLVSNSRVEDEKIVDTKVTVEDLVAVAVEESLKDANCDLKIKDEAKISRQRPIPIADLNVNPAECNLSEIEDLNGVSSTISCQPEQQGTYHTFFPTRPMELDEVEHGESSSAGKVLADQPHATQSLDLMAIEESWKTGNYSTGHSFSCRQFFPSEVGKYSSSAKDEHAGQIFTNLNLALAGAKSTSSLGSEIPLVLTLLQCPPNEDTVFRGPFRFSGGACNTAEHRNLELSLAFPNMTEGMLPVIGIDMNKPASEESVNTSLSLFGRGI